MQKDLIVLLEIYKDFGIDMVIEDAKVNSRVVEHTDEKKNIVHDVGISKEEQLQILKNEVEAFEGCELKKSATNTVFADGNCHADVMLIGEAPGANEDLEGIPFCGASGKLLDKMLLSIDLDRTSVYVTNTIFWRPPNNRRPSAEEIALCKPFLERHIAIINPKIIVLVGATAMYSVLQSEENISKVRGKFYSYSNNLLKLPITITAIFHPAYLMRQPMQKKLVWEDLKLIRESLNASSN